MHLVEFWLQVFRSEPFMRKVVRMLPLKVERRTVRKQQFVEVQVPYYPTLEDWRWASERLAERGWGKPKQDVLVDEGVEGGGVTIIHRRWAPGVDPLANREQVIEGRGRALPAPPAEGNGHEPYIRAADTGRP